MTTITGTIACIEYKNTAGHEKKVVTIMPGYKQCAFVEFRGWRMEELSPFKEGDDISVQVTLEGKTSKNSGIQYNNLVAVSIAKG